MLFIVTLLRSAETHENIVRVLDCCLVSDATVLVLEYCETDLSMFIKKHREFDPITPTILTDSLIKVVNLRLFVTRIFRCDFRSDASLITVNHA